MGTRHLFRFLWLFLVGHFLPGLTRQVSNVIAAACIVPRGGRVGLHSFMELYHCGQNVVLKPKTRCCDIVG